MSVLSVTRGSLRFMTFGTNNSTSVEIATYTIAMLPGTTHDTQTETLCAKNKTNDRGEERRRKEERRREKKRGEQQSMEAEVAMEREADMM